MDDLHAHRDELDAQLRALHSQHAHITREVQQAEEARHAALANDQDATVPTEHLKYRQIALQQTSWAIEQIRGRLAQTDAKLRSRARHQDLDGDLRQLVTDLRAYDEYRAQLDGAYQAAIDKVANIAKELHDLVWTARQRHDDLEMRARNLRVTARQLNRLNLAVPTPSSWKEPIEQALRGTGAAWRAYLTSVQNRAPEPFARELGAAAATALVTHRQTMR
ncbi:MAG TPA: hypothetical protein VF003_10845 [Pseudonocardiaceae bacterium]